MHSQGYLMVSQIWRRIIVRSILYSISWHGQKLNWAKHLAEKKKAYQNPITRSHGNVQSAFSEVTDQLYEKKNAKNPTKTKKATAKLEIAA